MILASLAPHLSGLQRYSGQLSRLEGQLGLYGTPPIKQPSDSCLPESRGSQLSILKHHQYFSHYHFYSTCDNPCVFRTSYTSRPRYTICRPRYTMFNESWYTNNLVTDLFNESSYTNSLIRANRSAAVCSSAVYTKIGYRGIPVWVIHVHTRTRTQGNVHSKQAAT